MPRKSKPGSIPGKRNAGMSPQPPGKGAAAISQVINAARSAFDRGDRAQAGAILQQALARYPEHPELLHLAGDLSLASGDTQQGIDLIRRAIKRAPQVALYHYHLGNAHSQRNELHEARDALQQAVRRDPRMKEAVVNLAVVHVRLRDLREAEALFGRAVALDSKDPKAWLNLARVRMELRKVRAADEAIQHAAALKAGADPDFLHEAGLIYQALGALDKAEQVLRKGLEAAPQDLRLTYTLGAVLRMAEKYGEAERLLRQVCEVDPQAFPARVELANLYISSGEVDKGREQLQVILDAGTRDPGVLLNTAATFALIGDFDRQEQVLHGILQTTPNHLAAQMQLAFVPHRQLADSQVGVLEKAIQDPAVKPESRSRMGFALGNHYRNVKQYDKAFTYYRQGNDLKGYRWDRVAYREWVQRTCDIYTPEFFAQRADWGSDSRMPVLIVGMLRSGTTLVEQILSAHSDVHGAGEFGSVSALASSQDLIAPDVLRDAASILRVDATGCAAMAANYLQRIGAQARHGEHFVTNKLPTNFQRVGLFALLFPHAPVIHVQRDPRDNLLSIYFEDFTGYHPYAYDLVDLAVQYREQERLMQHWKSVVPNPVFSLHYEDLVADLPDMIGRLADFLGIQPEPAMERFYEQERAIRTASKWQVRQKLYSSSVGRWQPYAKQLKPLLDALEELPAPG